MMLSDCANIRTGLVLARKEAKNDRVTQPFQYKQLTLRSFKADGLIDTTLLDSYETNERLSQRYLTQPDDVVIRLTYPYTAVIIEVETRGLVIPSHFAVIRPDKLKINPHYLLWLLNRDSIKKELAKNNTGTVIGTIKSSFFAGLEIAEIPLEKQAQMATLHRLAQRETLLLKKLAEQKELFNNNMLAQYYRYAKRGNQQ